MQKVNKGQIAAIHTLLHNIGMGKDKEFKEGLVRDFTDGRETSTTKLLYKEAASMIEALQMQAGWSKEAIQANQKRRRIIAMAHKVRLENADGTVDMDRLDSWCVHHGYLHKPFNEYSNAELSKLIYQFEQWYKSHLKGI